MTREQARQTLAGTWQFELVGDRIKLRDAELIAAIASYQRAATHPTPLAAPVDHGRAGVAVAR